jgi:hypothetical protein
VSDVRVTITLRKHVAEKLRGMCHARGETASALIDRWICERKDDGSLPAAPKKNIFDDMFGGIFDGKK